MGFVTKCMTRDATSNTAMTIITVDIETDREVGPDLCGDVNGGCELAPVGDIFGSRVCLLNSNGALLASGPRKLSKICTPLPQ